jgi:hypothetical protein
MYLLLHLFPGRGHYGRVVVADVYNSKGRHEIDVTFPVKAIEIEALSSYNREIRPVLREAGCQYFAAALHQFFIR